MGTPQNKLNFDGIVEPMGRPARPSVPVVGGDWRSRVNPNLVPHIDDIVNNLRGRGFDIRVGETSRTVAQQAEKIRQGVSRVKNPAKGPHVGNISNAVDLIVYENGKPEWSGKSPTWKLIGEEVRKRPNLGWGGDIDDLWDPGHIQIGGSLARKTASRAGVSAYQGQTSPQTGLNFDGIVEPLGDTPNISTEKPAPLKTPKVTSRVVEDFTDEPPKQIEFTPEKPEDRSDLQNMILGARRVAGAPNTLNAPSAQAGKPLTIRVQSDKSPTPEQLSDALLEAMGARDVGERYRQETGRNLLNPRLTQEDLEAGYDPHSKTYSAVVQPSRQDYDVVNAYSKGGVQGAHEVVGKNYAEQAKAIKELSDERDKAILNLKRMGYNPGDVSDGNGPIAKGLADTAIGLTHLLNNVSAPFRKAENVQAITKRAEEAESQIPQEKGAGGRIVRGITGLATSLPQYQIIPGLGGAALVAYMQNRHRGVGEATKSALEIYLAGKVLHGVAGKATNMSPATRQVISRGAAGAAGIGLAAASGERDIGRLLESGGVMAGMPIGRARSENVPQAEPVKPAREGLSSIADQMRAKGQAPLEPGVPTSEPQLASEQSLPPERPATPQNQPEGTETPEMPLSETDYQSIRDRLKGEIAKRTELETPRHERQNRRQRSTQTGRRGQFARGYKEAQPPAVEWYESGRVIPSTGEQNAGVERVSESSLLPVSSGEGVLLASGQAEDAKASPQGVGQVGQARKVAEGQLSASEVKKQPFEMTRQEFRELYGDYNTERFERINTGDENRLSMLDRNSGQWKTYERDNPSLMDNPQTVVVYRATEGKNVLPGDYIYLSRRLAQEHLREAGEPGWKILSREVPLHDIVGGQDSTEFIFSPKRATEKTHREYVKDALTEGKAVPANTLVGYPDLARKYAASVEQGAKGFEQRYSVATDVVDGRRVREGVPNQSSIAATFDDYDILPGIREIPMSEFDAPPENTRRSRELARQIEESSEINPLIVAVDAEGPYILEGENRFDALGLMGAKSFPALVVIDRETRKAQSSVAEIVIPQSQRQTEQPPTIESLDRQQSTPDLTSAFEQSSTQVKLEFTREPSLITNEQIESLYPEYKLTFRRTRPLDRSKQGIEVTFWDKNIARQVKPPTDWKERLGLAEPLYRGQEPVMASPSGVESVKERNQAQLPEIFGEDSPEVKARSEKSRVEQRERVRKMNEINKRRVEPIKAEKVNSRTGFTPSQAGYVTEKLRAARPTLPERPDGKTAVEIKVPNDGELTITSQKGADSLHRKLTGRGVPSLEELKPTVKTEKYKAAVGDEVLINTGKWSASKQGKVIAARSGRALVKVGDGDEVVPVGKLSSVAKLKQDLEGQARGLSPEKLESSIKRLEKEKHLSIEQGFALEAARAELSLRGNLPHLTELERTDYEQAKRNIKSKLSSSNLKSSDPYGLGVFADLAPDLLKVGKYHVVNGYREFKAWSEKMVEDLGEEIRPHLEKLWAHVGGEDVDRNIVSSPGAPRPVDSPKAASQVLPKTTRGTISVEPTGTKNADTAIKHAVVEAERELKGLPQFEAARRTHGQSFDEGVADVHSGRIDPRSLASDIVKAFHDSKFSLERFGSRRPRPLSTEESMALLYDRMRISNERQTVESELERAVKSGDEERITKTIDKVRELENASNLNDEADFRAGSEQARGLAIRRELIKNDYSRARVLATAVSRNRGKPLPPEIQTRLEDLTKQLEDAQQRAVEAETKAAKLSEQKESQGAVNRIQDEVRRERRQRRASTKQELDTEWAELKTQFAQARKEVKNVQASGLAGLDPEGKLTKLIGQMAKNRVKAGVNTIDGLVDEIHAQIKDYLDDKRAIRDAISGYGKESKPREVEAWEKELSGLKSQMRELSKKEDIATGKRLDPRQIAQQTRIEKRVAELEKELEGAKAGRVREKTRRAAVPETDAVKVAKHNADVLRRQIDDVYAVIDWQNKNITQKSLAYSAAIVRFNVLSGLKVLGKIGGALGQKVPQQYLEQLYGEGWKRLFPKVYEKAPRHGQGFTRASESAFAKGFKSGALEAPRIIKTGESALTLESGKRYPTIPTKFGKILSVPGRVHMAEKNPLKVGEYNRSLEMNLRWAKQRGLDRDNPQVIEQAKERALKDAEEIVMLGDNPFSRAISRVRRGMSPEWQSISRIIVPVERVPSNYISQVIGDYGLGVFRGSWRALRARNPKLLERMTPEEADKTARLLNRGTLGLTYAALVATGLIKAGGFWRKGEKEVESGDIQIGGITIPHIFLHSPPDELAQFAGTIKDAIKEAQAKGRPGGVLTGVARGLKGIAEQTPFLNQYTRVVDSFRSGDSLNQMLGQQVASWVEPQIMKELARVVDRDSQGQQVTRRPASFGEELMQGIPVVRRSVTINPVFGSQSSNASAEVQRLSLDLSDVKQKEDESYSDFKTREQRVNALIGPALENLVSGSDYQGKSDKERGEAIKALIKSIRSDDSRGSSRGTSRPIVPRVDVRPK